MSKNKTALITGASSGIGKELAHILAERGGNLVIVARSKDKLNALIAELENKMDVISGAMFPQKMMISAIPVLPKSMMLKQIRRMREV
ncbi:SDR family NAD(P)-dependent oxidoreductase [Chloroflexi bacterium TSY]|nr:SDR family NAD(P)-dependent oxidoreductase [Chloroflexi bacterium TSY]